jgi:hypothetical protein
MKKELSKFGWSGSPSGWIDDSRYEVYKSNVIIDNQSKLVTQLLEFHNETDYRTKNFDTYNIFTECKTNEMYDLFFEVKSVVRNHIPHGRLWLQAWLNAHRQDECLDWHHHTFPYHGYISVEPKDTITEFAHWKVKNEIGNIYFGIGGQANEHRVKVNTPYDDHRITIGFDVQSVPSAGANKFIPI